MGFMPDRSEVVRYIFKAPRQQRQHLGSGSRRDKGNEKFLKSALRAREIFRVDGPARDFPEKLPMGK
jgi:hypothetical protein